MRANTKLKKILEKHTVGLSFSDASEMTTINLQTKERKQFNGETFSEMISKAYADFEKNKIKLSKYEKSYKK
jgi:hypothetical protein